MKRRVGLVKTPAMTAFTFHLDAVDPHTGARAGRWITPHGTVETPAFMPVGTLGTVKGLLPEQLRQSGAQMVLANTYHLALRPGSEVVESLGGLHRFMDWSGPILTDSGGFQVFSLAQLRQLNDEKAVFRSHIDGSTLELSPERAVQIQEQLGADVIMCLDECPPSGESRDKIRAAVDRTTLWAKRCRDAQKRTDQALFGIVQGGVHPDLRARSAEACWPLDFRGMPLGVECWRTAGRDVSDTGKHGSDPSDGKTSLSDGCWATARHSGGCLSRNRPV